MLAGFWSVEEEGLPPGNCHSQDVGLLFDESKKLVQNFSQTTESEAAKELVCAAHAVTSGDSSASVYNRTLSRISSVQSLHICPQLVNLIV